MERVKLPTPRLEDYRTMTTSPSAAEWEPIRPRQPSNFFSDFLARPFLISVGGECRPHWCSLAYVGDGSPADVVMAGVRHNDPGRSDREAAPPFWLQTDRAGTTIVDSCVVAAARDNWSWAFWLIKRELHDGTRMAEIVQDVAIEVTTRLRADADVGRNLNGYIRTSIIRRVKTIAIRESRVIYEGAAHDLEANHQPASPDWTKVFDDRITLRSLAPYMSHPVRTILHYRMADYSWKRIAQLVGLTEKQAKSRFYYGARQAYEELLAVQKKRANAERDPSNGRQ